MFRTLECRGAGDKLHETEDLAAVGRPAEGCIRWIDVGAQTDAELSVLKERFDFHPLALEDCAHFDQRPKLEEYGSYLFIVIHGFRSKHREHAADVDPLEVHAFLGKDYLITVHSEPIAELDHTWKRVAGDPALLRRGADFVYYLLVDEIVDGNFLLLDEISELLDHIEEQVLHRQDREHLTDIFALKKTLVAMRRVLSPQRDVFAILAKRGHPNISERTSVYFRDVYDHLVRIYESIDTGRDLLGNALDAHLSMAAQRTNDVMKRLTVLSAIFLPLAFVVGFFGQNFHSLPGLNEWVHSRGLMWVMIVLCLLIPPGMLLWFHRSRWI